MIATLLSLLGLFLLLVPYIIRRNLRDSEGNPIPSGPLFRYAFLRDDAHYALDKWAKKYGPLYSFWTGNQLCVVISDAEIARDLLVQCGATFSSRKQYFIKNDIILKNRAVTGSPYGPKWKQHRRLALQYLTPKTIETNYTNIIEYETRVLIKSLFDESKRGTVPISPSHYATRFTINVQLALSLGTRTFSTKEPLIKKIDSLVSEFGDLTGPLNNAVDFIPFLKHLPTPIRRRATKLSKDLREVYGGLVQEMRLRHQRGEEIPNCLAKTLIETQEQEKLDDDDVCMLVGVFLLGGIPSASYMIQWFLAFMAAHPDVVDRAHEELDLIVGRDRLPTADDEKSLPYVRAIVKEIQRVNATFWIPTPHYTTADHVYSGKYIPKDTLVLLNCWTLHHNPERYPEPLTFNPERYLGNELSCAESSRLAKGLDRDHWAFGSGRRICPGIAAAERELWMAISGLLWAFKFEPVEGEPLPVIVGTTGGAPPPMRIRVSARDHHTTAMLEQVEERASQWDLS
ncbi:cytochrome P450 [Mycena floridula]|nr:cytochrome P450 [Mycena floridula]